jgi:hypothetical protein
MESVEKYYEKVFDKILLELMNLKMFVSLCQIQRVQMWKITFNKTKF